MRGKGISSSSAFFAARITPAYAGKSFRLIIIDNSRRDHPRLCGEKSLTGKTAASQLGSPPPMRGKVKLDQAEFGTDGITPAYAGKSFKVSTGGLFS